MLISPRTSATSPRLIDIESVSGAEKPRRHGRAGAAVLPHLTVLRDGDAVVARTELGQERRVVLPAT